ncbi:MAG: hypothetical protein IPJ81_00700 [Chitinophagaceae bacterium]|nr:hypothetical protein [Chitinophagaceae bacterium]
MKKLLSLIVISLLFFTSYSQDFAAQAALLKNQEFVSRIEIAITKAANQVGNEVKDVNKPILYAKRHKLSYQVINNDMTLIFARSIVSSNTDINLNSTDNDILFMVTSVWDNVAGVQSDEK